MIILFWFCNGHDIYAPKILLICNFMEMNLMLSLIISVLYCNLMRLKESVNFMI